MKRSLSWQNPLEFAKKISDNYSEESWVLLYSGLNNIVRNSFSYIALFPKEKIACDNFEFCEKKLKNSSKRWFGYLSYEIAHNFEKFARCKKSYINLPEINLVRFSLIFEFDHDKNTLTAIFEDKKELDEVLLYKTKRQAKITTKISKFSSNFSNQSYLAAISSIKKMIARGDFYQTNLTRKFFGQFSKKQNQQSSFKLFSDLTKISPSNYSSFLKLEESFIISSSPELFLKTENSKVISRPIKGTMPRSSNIEKDKENKLALKNSAKECAENLMIVDLVRNDLARTCKPKSIKVEKLFNIESYKNVHHMSSEIQGQILKKFSTCDIIKTTFPAGSMTGAPKIKAMETAAKKEKVNRGVYSGAIGFLDGKKSINLSVVIRTLILQNKKFEFQTGGAITFDSDPQSELAETFSKAKLLIKLLKVGANNIK